MKDSKNLGLLFEDDILMLDEDDILNYEETLRRYELGIDTNFLVKHFG